MRILYRPVLCRPRTARQPKPGSTKKQREAPLSICCSNLSYASAAIVAVWALLSGFPRGFVAEAARQGHVPGHHHMNKKNRAFI